MVSTLDSLLASAEVTDSTDFPDDTATPGLRAFDDAVRCDICRDFYDAPVTLNCGHCFCSGCIRTALPEQGSCPTCRKPASEVHLRKNVAMESAVHAWKTARLLILRLACEEQNRRAVPPPNHKRASSSNSHVPERIRKRPKRAHSTSSADDEIIIVPSSPIPSGSSTPDALAVPELVLCPMCQKEVPGKTINMHIDSECKRYTSEGSTSSTFTRAKSKQKQQWSKLLRGGVNSKVKDRDNEKGKGKARASPEHDTSDPTHLPKVAYDIHPQKRIAEMLIEWDLPAHGDKAALVRRHKRWVVLYNANVDRALTLRRTLDQLRHDLRRLEDADSQRIRKETVDDPVAYQKANKAAFAKLTEAARPKRAEAQAGDESIPSDPASMSSRDLAGEEGAPAPPPPGVIDVDDET